MSTNNVKCVYLTRDVTCCNVVNFEIDQGCFFSFRMVLVFNGVLQEECPPDTRSLYHAHPMYRDTAAQLLAIPNKVIGPVGLLYVLQRELAATVPHDSKFMFPLSHFEMLVLLDTTPCCHSTEVKLSYIFRRFSVSRVDALYKVPESFQNRLIDVA